jgi:hypothetical protein
MQTAAPTKTLAARGLDAARVPSSTSAITRIGHALRNSRWSSSTAPRTACSGVQQASMMHDGVSA